MSTPTATPRTDDEETPLITNHRVSAETYKRMVDLARTLETELSAARSDIAHYLRDNLTAHQMACAAGLERDQLRAEVEALKQSIESGQRVLREDAERNAARAERVEAELAEWSVLNLWGGTPEIIHEFIKGQQNRIHYRQDLETELESLRAEVERWQAEAEEMSAQRSHNANQAGILRAEVEQKSNLLVTAIKSAGDQAARAERAEADKARLDWLEAHALPQHSPNISISDLGRHYNGFPGSFRAAIDAAMKGTT